MRGQLGDLLDRPQKQVTQSNANEHVQTDPECDGNRRQQSLSSVNVTPVHRMSDPHSIDEEGSADAHKYAVDSDEHVQRDDGMVAVLEAGEIEGDLQASDQYRVKYRLGEMVQRDEHQHDDAAVERDRQYLPDVEGEAEQQDELRHDVEDGERVQCECPAFHYFVGRSGKTAWSMFG